MYKAVILPLAKEDVREAAIWYNKQQKGLGKRFTAEVRENVHFIRQNPKASNIRYNSVRTAVLNVFPFMIHFTVDEKNKTVIVSAVLHTSRNPELWKNR
ncbi:type II toxin-antitoxin system RelE/ParE family toxin [Geofilum sp. OHC36d9]|uniref:type II toxin-antitoxin system RelE/ParE family toxin n=1 Tax=Geofilum sp. OHC36d9 TaxID=3458413 RepID=UPI004033D1DE